MTEFIFIQLRNLFFHNHLLLGWLLLQTRIKLKIDSYFKEFGQVKNKPYNKTPLEETGYLSNFFGYLSMPPELYPGFSGLWRSPPALSSTLTTFGSLLFMIVSASSFLFRYPVFRFTSLFLTQPVGLSLVTYPTLCSTSMTYMMPCHSNGHQVLPTQHLPRKAEDFPMGSNHPRQVLLFIYLA